LGVGGVFFCRCDALEKILLKLAMRGLLVPQNPAEEPARVLLKNIRAEKDRLIAAGVGEV